MHNYIHYEDSQGNGQPKFQLELGATALQRGAAKTLQMKILVNLVFISFILYLKFEHKIFNVNTCRL